MTDVLVAPGVNDSIPEPVRTASGGRWLAIVIAFVVATNLVVLADLRLPFIGPMAGFMLLVGLPTWLLYVKVKWKSTDAVDRLGYSLVLAILLLLLLGLTINTALPLIGIRRALDRVPVLLAVDTLCLGLGWWRRDRWRSPARPAFLRLPDRSDRIILALSALTVPMAVVGAVRLNNGADSNVTFAMLVVVGATLLLLLRWRETLHPGTVAAAFYLVGLALLLMTSLRGWYTTGHDIQREYRVFELTKSHGNWNVGRFQDAYSACLSITILPTMVSQMTKVADVYVFKVFFQVLFAFCPVLVYRVARRHTSAGISMLAVIYFVSFPTYFTDMPFLNRQEVAFLFVGAALLVVGDPAMGLRSKQIMFGVFSVGMVLTHYSTAYLLLGTIFLAWLARMLLRALSVARGRVPRWAWGRTVPARSSPWMVIGLANVAVMLLAVVLWNGVATHTSDGLSTTLASAVRTIRGATSPNSKSSDVSYNIFALHKPSEQERLDDYKAMTLAETDAGRLQGDFYSRSVMAQYPAPLVTTAELAPSAAGRALDRVGISVSTLNAAIRLGSAKLLQLFVGVGLLAMALSRRRRRRYLRSGAEFYLLGVAAFVIVLLQVLIPVLSIQYGVLRAFLQALMILGPFVAIGSLVIVGRMGERWAFRVASALALGFFLSLSGVIPQALGGYPPQLHLNNAGDYYDLYYVHPQEVAGINWLRQHAPTHLDAIQSEVVTDRYSFTPVTRFVSTSPLNDIYPTLLRDGSYVFLGFTTVQSDRASVAYAGDLLTYRYPTALLDNTRDLLYSSDGSRIYR